MEVEEQDWQMPRKHESAPILGRMSLIDHQLLPKFPGALNKNLEVTQIDSPRMEPTKSPILFEMENLQGVPTLAQSPSFGQLPASEMEMEKSTFAKEEKPFKTFFKKD